MKSLGLQTEPEPRTEEQRLEAQPASRGTPRAQPPRASLRKHDPLTALASLVISINDCNVCVNSTDIKVWKPLECQKRNL